MSRNAVFVDTDAWIYLLSQTDQYNRQARALLQELRAEDCAFITSSAVILEVGDGLATRDLRAFSWLFRALLDAPKVEVVVVDGTWLDAGWKLFDVRPDSKWTLTDCLSFAIMREYDLRDAFTRDPHFEQAGFRALLRQN